MYTPFPPNPELQKAAERYTLDAVEFAKSEFRIALDQSESSIDQVETVLAKLHEAAAARDKPPAKAVWGIAMFFGSYIGQVFRAHHGGNWVIVEFEGEKNPGIQSPSGICFWPWIRANKRIIEGPENNVLHYYQLAVEKERLPRSPPQ